MTAALLDISARAEVTSAPATAGSPPRSGDAFDDAITDAVSKAKGDTRRPAAPRREDRDGSASKRDRDDAADKAAAAGLVDVPARAPRHSTSPTVPVVHAARPAGDASHHHEPLPAVGRGAAPVERAKLGKHGIADSQTAAAPSRAAHQPPAVAPRPTAQQEAAPAPAPEYDRPTRHEKPASAVAHARPQAAAEVAPRGAAAAPADATPLVSRRPTGAHRAEAPRIAAAPAAPTATSPASDRQASYLEATGQHRVTTGAGAELPIVSAHVPTVTGSLSNSAPAATAPPVAVPAPALAQPDVANILARLRGRTDGTYQLSAQIHPAELGAVHIAATVAGGTLTVLLTADSQAHHALSQALPQLRDHLADQGFTGVDVGLGSPDQHAGDTADRAGGHRAQGSDHRVGGTAGVTDDDVPVVRRRADHAGTIDRML